MKKNTKFTNLKIFDFFKDDKVEIKKFKTKISSKFMKKKIPEKLKTKEILKFLKNRNLDENMLNLDVLINLKNNIMMNFEIEENNLNKIIEFTIKRFTYRNKNILLEKKYKPFYKEEIFNNKNYSKFHCIYKNIITDLSSKFRNEKNIILIKGDEGNGKSTLAEAVANSNEFLIEKIDLSKFASLRKFVEDYKNLLNYENIFLNYKMSEDNNKIQNNKIIDWDKKKNKINGNIETRNNKQGNKEIKIWQKKKNFFNLKKNQEEESFYDNQSSNSFPAKSFSTMETIKFPEMIKRKTNFTSYKKNKKKIIKKEKNFKKSKGNFPTEKNTKILSFFRNSQDLEVLKKLSNDNFEISNKIPWKFKKVFIFENIEQLIQNKKKDQTEFKNDIKFFFKFIRKISFPCIFIINNSIENEIDGLLKDFKKNILTYDMIDDNNLESIFFYIVLFLEKNFCEVKFQSYNLKIEINEIFEKNLKKISNQFEFLNGIFFPNMVILKNFIKICNHNFYRIYSFIQFQKEIFFPQDKFNGNEIEIQNFLYDIKEIEVERIKKIRSKDDFLKSIKKNFSSINIDYQNFSKNIKQKNIKSFFKNEKFTEKNKKLINESVKKNININNSKYIKNKGKKNISEKINLEPEFLSEKIINEFKRVIKEKNINILIKKDEIIDDIFNKTYYLKSNQNYFIGKEYIQKLSFDLNFFN